MGKFEDAVTPLQISEEYQEAIDIFPALHKYKTEHNTSNLQKLCVEVSDFCKAIYASTENDAERTVYKNMVHKLNNQ